MITDKMIQEPTVAPVEYRCAQCGGVFESDWSNDEAIAEAAVLFPSDKPSDMAIVCDDCFNSLIGQA